MNPPVLSVAWQRFRHEVKGDLHRYAGRTDTVPGGKFAVYALLFLPGFKFIFAHRLQLLMRSIPVVGRFLSKLYWTRNCIRFGSEIAQFAEIAPGFYTPSAPAHHACRTARSASAATTTCTVPASVRA
jgi:serine O-acetyltransferase